MRKVYIVMQKPSTEPPRIFKVFRRKKDAENLVEWLDSEGFETLEHWVICYKIERVRK
jgi:hypothetical protein